jgi:hypothetical protein
MRLEHATAALESNTSRTRVQQPKAPHSLQLLHLMLPTSFSSQLLVFLCFYFTKVGYVMETVLLKNSGLLWEKAIASPAAPPLHTSKKTAMLNRLHSPILCFPS